MRDRLPVIEICDAIRNGIFEPLFIIEIALERVVNKP